MSGTFKLGRFLGIDVKIHFSWIFIFALLAWILSDNILPARYPGWTQQTYLFIGITGSLLLFVSVLVHEFAHSLVAISRGHAVKSITLFFLGGVSEIEEESHSASEEFLISAAGPAMSFGLSLIFWLLSILIPSGVAQVKGLAEYLAIMNLVLGIFNLIPAFPLDGGRVLKSLVWKATGNEDRAINASSLAGSALGFVFIGVGILFVLRGNLLNGLWLVFIGWFIQSSASSIRRQKATENTLAGKTVSDAMRTEVPKVMPGITVQALVDQYINEDFERAYLVTLGGDTYQGLVTITDVKKLPHEERANKYITEIMTKASEVRSVEVNDPLESALEMLVETGYHQLVVVENGRPIGLVTRGDVLRVLEIAQLFPSASNASSVR